MMLKPCIALFRGINVGKGNRLDMKELVALLEDLGCRNARTYIQSGNAVFEAPLEDFSQLSTRIRLGIKNRFGFEPCVLLLRPDDLSWAIERNPFPEAEQDPTALHLGFLDSEPREPDLFTLEALRSPSERFQLTGRVFYLFAPEGVGRSRLAAGAERVLGLPMTDRNWRTVCKVMELVSRIYEAP